MTDALDDNFDVDTTAMDDSGIFAEPASEPKYDDATPTKFITGPAGTGKTYRVRKAVEEDPTYAITACTTGIAAVNLNTNTINSILGYFDTASMRDARIDGKLTSRLKALSQRYRYIAVDEVSMMDAEQLDLLYDSVEDINSDGDLRPFGILLTGDFAQLPPVKGKWAFQAESWHHFAKNTEKLNRIYRQDDERFLEALKHARAGNALEASTILGDIAKFSVTLDDQFDGTTIFDKNDKVDRFNQVRFRDLKAAPFKLPSRRWGKARGEWKLIPEDLWLKEGALVMILANSDRDAQYRYANGDLAYVTGEKSADGVIVRLKRTEQEVEIPYITRHTTVTHKPVEYAGVDIWGEERGQTSDQLPNDLRWGRVYFDRRKRKYIDGAIEYVPLRLAYAATVHKTQGLTLDTVQIDPRGHFFGSPNMAYVALSRVKTPGGLRVVGSPGILKTRIKIAEEVRPWVV